MGMFGYGALEDWTNQYGIYLLLREESTDKVFFGIDSFEGIFCSSGATRGVITRDKRVAMRCRQQ